MNMDRSGVLIKYKSKSEGQTAYHTRSDTISEHDLSSDNDSNHIQSSQSVIYPNNNPKDSKHSQYPSKHQPINQTKQLRIKLSAKVPQYQTTDEKDIENQATYKSTDIESHIQLDSHSQNRTKHNNNLKSLKQVPYIPENDPLSKANLFVSSVISIMYVLHTVYWEYISVNHTNSHSYQNLEVSLAMCLLNLIPSLAMLMDIYSVILSMLVLLHVSWMAYHTLTVWSVELCYGAIDDGCNAIQLFKNVTLCMHAVIAAHQILLMLTGWYQNKVKSENTRIQHILTKAANLDIQSETDINTIDKNSASVSVSASVNASVNTANDSDAATTYVLQSFPINQNIRANQIGIESQNPTSTYVTTNMFDHSTHYTNTKSYNSYKEGMLISESAAEEIEIDQVYQRNEQRAIKMANLYQQLRRKRVRCHSVPMKVLKSKINKSQNIKHNMYSDNGKNNNVGNNNSNKTAEGYLNNEIKQDNVTVASNISSMDNSVEIETVNDDSTFEMYGIGTPKETHGKSLSKPVGLRLAIV